MQLQFSIFQDSSQSSPPAIDTRIAEKQARNRERCRAYVAAHPEENRKRAHDWYHANKERAAATRKAYAQANREATRARQRRWEEAQKEAAREARRLYQATEEYQQLLQERLAERAQRAREWRAAWRAANPDRVNATRRRWIERHPEQAHLCDMERVQKRLALIRGARIGPVSFKAIRERDGDICQICGLAVTPETLSFDHRIPLSKGGSHTEDNLQIAHRSCNYRKGAKLPDS